MTPQSERKQALSQNERETQMKQHEGSYGNVRHWYKRVGVLIKIKEPKRIEC